MAEYEDEEVTHPADPPAALVDFVGSFQDEQARGVMRDAAVRIQDYVTRRQIADDNRAMSNRLVSNLGQFKDGLAEMAYDDPSAVDLGLDIAPDIVRGIIDSNPFLPEDQRGGIADNLAGDIQREVARSGVMSLADRDAGAAKSLLSEERIAGLFDEQATAGLNGYINAMDTARTMDNVAVAAQRAKDDALTTNYTMAQHLSGLVDPQTGELAFPGGWAQRVIADPAIPPPQTAGMLGLYRRLQTNGDVPSDPYTLAGLIDDIAQGRVRDAATVLSHVGDSLSVSDAVGLAYSAINPRQTREMQSLSSVLRSARETLAAPENGAAGAAAYGRFVNWLIPGYRAAGAGSLDPNAENTIMPAADRAPGFWSQFMPRGDDLVAAYRPQADNRPSLSDILGGARRRAG